MPLDPQYFNMWGTFVPSIPDLPLLLNGIIERAICLGLMFQNTLHDGSVHTRPRPRLAIMKGKPIGHSVVIITIPTAKKAKFT
jgi:hypothetical protein